jgi:hypothetical protein
LLWHHLWLALAVGCGLTLSGLVLAILYSRRREILDGLAHLPAGCWRQWQSAHAVRRLATQRSAAETSLRQLYEEHTELIGEDGRRRLTSLTKKLQTLPTTEEVHRFAERRREQVLAAQRQQHDEERREGPNRRSDARQRVRLFYAAYAPALSARHDASAIERYLATAMHDSLPSRQVVEAGQKLIDHFERQLIVDEVHARLTAQRDEFASRGLSEEFLRRYIGDALGGHRPVATVRQAADELLSWLAIEDDQAADRQGVPEIDLWATAESYVDQELRSWKVTITEEERRQWIQRRYDHLQRQKD